MHAGSHFSTNEAVENFPDILDFNENNAAEIYRREYICNAHQSIIGARSNVCRTMLESDFALDRMGMVQVQDTNIRKYRNLRRFLKLEKKWRIQYFLSKKSEMSNKRPHRRNRRPRGKRNGNQSNQKEKYFS